jgi:D-alanyl-lipoteichoic acid acyltransferase DltB (MBOAT superfamily)
MFLMMPVSRRRALLLTFSLGFYAAVDFQHLHLLLVLASAGYVIALKIESSSASRQWLICGLLVTLGGLFYFKYADFFSFRDGAAAYLLPLGISFYTFHIISYLIDVYRGVIPAEPRVSSLLLYILFWPQLLAGPILRAKEVLPQLQCRQHFSFANLGNGCRHILIGLFLKIILADRLAPFVDNAFSTSPHYLGGVDVVSMAFAFGFQIYFDFSAYSYIAMGTATLFGITFPANFNWPYLATSPKISGNAGTFPFRLGCGTTSTYLFSARGLTIPLKLD